MECNARVKKFEDGKLYVDLKNTDGKEEEKIISTDSVVLCVGYASENGLYDELKYDVSNLYMRSGSQKVFYCRRWDITPLKEWNSFSEMLIEEIQRLKSLHGTDGMLKSTRRSTLPIA